MIVVGRHSHRSLLTYVDILELGQGCCNGIRRLSLLGHLLRFLSAGVRGRNREHVLSHTKSQACIGINWLWASSPFFQQIPSLRLAISVGLRSADGACRCLRLRRVPSVSVARCTTSGGSSLQILGALASKGAVVLEESTSFLERLFIRA